MRSFNCLALQYEIASKLLSIKLLHVHLYVSIRLFILCSFSIYKSIVLAVTMDLSHSVSDLDLPPHGPFFDCVAPLPRLIGIMNFRLSNMDLRFGSVLGSVSDRTMVEVGLSGASKGASSRCNISLHRMLPAAQASQDATSFSGKLSVVSSSSGKVSPRTQGWAMTSARVYRSLGSSQSMFCNKSMASRLRETSNVSKSSFKFPCWEILSNRKSEHCAMPKGATPTSIMNKVMADAQRSVACPSNGVWLRISGAMYMSCPHCPWGLIKRRVDPSETSVTPSRLEGSV
jgi:hypothetical protein